MNPLPHDPVSDSCQLHCLQPALKPARAVCPALKANWISRIQARDPMILLPLRHMAESNAGPVFDLKRTALARMRTGATL
jgi:hypothetical protein